jgi:glyoxylase-like metal-dependent hydrolase (beta-lactamase superfamily II)
MAYEEMVTPQMEKDFQRSRMFELAPDFWMLEGWMSATWSKNITSANIFTARDGDTVLLHDTGLYPFYRQRTLDRLRKYGQEGARRLVLLNSHGHFDHIANNDVLLEAGFPEVKFLATEPELKVFHLATHYADTMKELAEYYDPYTYEPWISAANYQKLMTGAKTLVERAQILTLKDRKARKFGDVEVAGWEVGRFFAIHDAGQTPGHVCLYDPQHKVMIAGDLCMDIQPPFLECSMKNCLNTNRKFRRMAEQGFIETATDCHRMGSFLPSVYADAGVKPLHPLQLAHLARGKQECIEVYGAWDAYYTPLVEETLAAHRRIGEATVPEIAAELSKSEHPAVRLKKAWQYPSRPSRIGVLVAVVMKENGVPRRREGDRVLFAPVGK